MAEWRAMADQWLDTDEQQAAAWTVIQRLWHDKIEPYRSDLESVVFLYIHDPDDPRRST